MSAATAVARGVGPVVGIVGGGQLARMLAEAATPLGIHVRVLAAAGEEGASEVVPDVVVGAADDPAALIAFAAGLDVLTFDHENVDHAAIEQIEAAGTPVRPGVPTLRFADKAHQRRELAAAGVPVPPFDVLDPEAPNVLDVARRFAESHGGRAVLKASRGGYDGRGVWVLGVDELGDFLASYRGAPLVIEPLLDLERELAVLVARRPSGEVAVWPVVETVQVDGMCNEVLLPAPVDGVVAEAAAELGVRVAEVTGAVGVFAIELFVVRGADAMPGVLVNEIAPRVHNSGHLTIEGCRTSQFEQHLRAVLDWPLGPVDPVAPAIAMANVVGAAGEPRDRQAAALAAVPDAHVHLYGKSPRPGRKVGHVTVLGDDLEHVRRRANLAADTLAGVTGSTDD